MEMEKVKGRRLCISDIHGGYKALMEVLKKANIDYDNDKLIVIGDVCDGWPEIRECFEEIMKFKNLIYILGNHDDWARTFYNTGIEPMGWYSQGGHGTIESFEDNMPADILLLLNNAPAYHIEDNILFVHGGFDPNTDIKKHSKQHLIWDRDLMYKAKHTAAIYQQRLRYIEKHPSTPELAPNHKNKVSDYDKIFIGHTPTINFDNMTKPITVCEVTLIDTGASYYGPLTLVDVDSGEYWQSDPVNELYPGIKARGHYRFGPLPKVNIKK